MSTSIPNDKHDNQKFNKRAARGKHFLSLLFLNGSKDPSFSVYYNLLFIYEKDKDSCACNMYSFPCAVFLSGKEEQLY
jgi:hypothetical protein